MGIEACSPNSNVIGELVFTLASALFPSTSLIQGPSRTLFRTNWEMNNQAALLAIAIRGCQPRYCGPKFQFCNSQCEHIRTFRTSFATLPFWRSISFSWTQRKGAGFFCRGPGEVSREEPKWQATSHQPKQASEHKGIDGRLSKVQAVLLFAPYLRLGSTKQSKAKQSREERQRTKQAQNKHN